MRLVRQHRARPIHGTKGLVIEPVFLWRVGIRRPRLPSESWHRRVAELGRLSEQLVFPEVNEGDSEHKGDRHVEEWNPGEVAGDGSVYPEVVPLFADFGMLVEQENVSFLVTVRAANDIPSPALLGSPFLI